MNRNEEIKQGNKLLVEFMEFPVREFTSIEGKKWKAYCALPEPLIRIPVGNEGSLYYHKDWNWLMPVIRKINGLGKEYQLAIFKNYVSCTVEKGGKFYKDFSFTHAEYITAEQDDITAAFKLVVKFVEWYNINVKAKQELNINE
jgi:hypothetical protein